MSAVNYVLGLIWGTSPEMELLGTYHVQWYMLIMAVFPVLTYFVREVNPALVFSVSILLAMCSGYDTEIGNDFFLSKIISFYPFFFAGYALDPNKIVEFVKKKHIKIISAVFLICFVVFVFSFTSLYEKFRPLMFISTGGFYSKLPYPSLGGLYRLLYFIGVFALSFAIISVTPVAKNRFSEIGSRTLQIYFLHVPLLNIYFRSGLNAFLKANLPIPESLILITVAIILTFLLSFKCFKKPFDFLFSISGKKTAKQEG